MAYYKNQPVQIIIGDENIYATLTNSYDDTTVIRNAGGFDLATIYIEYIPAENTSACYIQFEAGVDDAHLFPKVAFIEEDASGESVSKNHVFKLEAAAAGTAVKKRILVELADIKMRISAKETTVGDYGQIKIILIRNEQ